MVQELKFNVKYRVPVRIIYDALTNPMELTRLTQTPAKFDKTSGGVFNLYDGFISGTNESLEENKKIVQKWKFNNWKDHADLTLTFKEKDGNDSLIVFNLQNIPERDSFGTTVDLQVLEKGFRSQIFQKINDYLGYPINNDKDDTDDDE